LGVVARAGRHDGLHLAALHQRAYLVGRAANLERAGLLPVLALEPDLAPGHRRKRGAGAQLGLVYYSLEPLLRKLKILQRKSHIHTSHVALCVPYPETILYFWCAIVNTSAMNQHKLVLMCVSCGHDVGGA